MANPEGKLVKFKKDVSPYCKGDIVRLSKEEKKRVDEAAKIRDLDEAYVEYTPTKEEAAQAKEENEAQAAAEAAAAAGSNE